MILTPQYTITSKRNRPSSSIKEVKNKSRLFSVEHGYSDNDDNDNDGDDEYGGIKNDNNDTDKCQ
eukprot:Pgem_evm1s16620